MNYKLNTNSGGDKKTGALGGVKRLLPFMAGEGRNGVISLVGILVNSLSSLITPVIIARAVDTSLRNKDMHGVLMWALVLLLVYLVGLYASYKQTITMGGIGRRVLYNLRNALFSKLQSLPVAFFNQNKSGDLISRINNDTDKLNQFFAQALMQFIGNLFMIVGAGVFLVSLNWKLGGASLIPALLVLIATQLISPWVKRVNFRSLQSLGGMSGEIQESISNFKVIVVFNRLDYFRDKFNDANQKNYKAAVSAGIANNVFTPLYTLAYGLAQLVVLYEGIHLIATGNFTVGLLIGFLLYVNSFYFPLRQLASVWSSFQQALAALDRISEVLALHTDMDIVPSLHESGSSVLEFKNVSFRYADGSEVLRHTSFTLEKGKTYALVGPTGGGKTTTASLMARLYDPTEGTVLLSGRDIQSYTPEERAKKIGFILQEPYLFTGTVQDNILYGNQEYHSYTNEELAKLLESKGLAGLLSRFPEGIETKVTSGGDAISLGQKQLIAFMRAVLREPELLILDEATANIDTVTEEQLEIIVSKLPVTTTKVIIAHRLNTIRSADEIFFVNGGEITLAGSMQNALDMLLHGKRAS